MFSTATNLNNGGFGSSNTNGSLFGGGGFGSSNTQLTTTTTNSSSVFGQTSNNQQQSQGLFGNSNTTNSNQQLSTFGNQQPNTTSTFGNSTNSLSMFGNSSTSTNNTNSGGGIFGGNNNTFGTSGTTNTFGGFGGSTNTFGASNTSFANNNTGGMMNQFGQQQQMNMVPIRPFSEAIPLLGDHDANELRYANVSTSNTNEANSGSTRDRAIQEKLIPEPLRKQIAEQNAEIDTQSNMLREIKDQANQDAVNLLAQTVKMEQAVLHLRNSVTAHAEKVKALQRDCIPVKVVKNAISEARHTGNAEFTVKKTIPSEFFLDLVANLERNFEQYEARTNDLVAMVHNSNRPKNRSQTQQMVTILQKQYAAFKTISIAVSEVHEKMDELRNQYRELHSSRKGAIPRDFDIEDNKEKEFRRKQMRQIEEMGMRLPMQPSQAGTQNGNGYGAAVPVNTGGLFGSATTAAAAPTGGMFGGTAPAASAGGIFGGTTPAATSTGGMFGATTTAAPSTGAMFGGTTTAAPSTGAMFGATTPAAASTGGMFGGTAAATTGGVFGSTAPPASGLFGGSSQTPAPSGVSTSLSLPLSSMQTPQQTTTGSSVSSGSNAPRKFNRRR